MDIPKGVQLSLMKFIIRSVWWIFVTTRGGGWPIFHSGKHRLQTLNSLKKNLIFIHLMAALSFEAL